MRSLLTGDKYWSFWGIYTVLYLNYELEYRMGCIFLFMLFQDQPMNS